MPTVFPFHSALYASLSMLLLTVLAMRTTMLRRRHHVFAGHGGVPALQAASRMHGVSFEHLLPLILMLCFFEALGGQTLWVDVFGGAILVGRLVQVIGWVTKTKLRQAGMGLTYLLEISLPLAVLWEVLQRLNHA